MPRPPRAPPHRLEASAGPAVRSHRSSPHGSRPHVALGAPDLSRLLTASPLFSSLLSRLVPSLPPGRRCPHGRDLAPGSPSPAPSPTIASASLSPVRAAASANTSTAFPTAGDISSVTPAARPSCRLLPSSPLWPWLWPWLWLCPFSRESGVGSRQACEPVLPSPPHPQSPGLHTVPDHLGVSHTASRPRFLL